MITDIVTVRPETIDTAEAEQTLRRAADILRRGGLVVFPTETVYGLGADGTCAEAAKRIYEAKGRPSDNPLILHVASVADAARVAFTNEVYDALAAAFMPGPLTVILPARDTVPKEVRGGLATVAIRCPSHPVAHRLIEYCGVPIAAPSANRSGSPSPTNASHVRDDMDGLVDMIIDGGESQIGLESTIVQIEEDGSVVLLRPGGITVEDLKAVVGEVRVSHAVTGALRPGERVLSPGMKYRHYAPKAPVLLMDGATEDVIRYIQTEGMTNIGILCYDEDRARFAAALPQAVLYLLGPCEDTKAQAHTLFYLLREADKRGFDKLYAPLPSKEGIGLALYNRLIRAASYTICTLKK
ncbi:MAG: threonylcarbamoyl-AMP synthase [Clostridia bacterium]|nr:threonylcarbamoyl-AMP synthase [Clostridia bacterium]